MTKVFGGSGGAGVRALDGLDLDVADGEFLAVLGPSGCGKSTLLRLIAGLEDETSGDMELDGIDLSGLEPKDRDIAIMFQGYALLPHLNVLENMAFGLRLRGMRKREAHAQAGDMASALGLGELLGRYPSELSGGQRQRAALGRAILRRPKLFLFDEPLSNLDARMRAQLRVEISRLHRDLGATMLFVTHDQAEAMAMGDRVAVLAGGVLQQVAKPSDLYDRPANTMVAAFLGSPGMNLFPGRLAQGPAGLRFQCGEFQADIPPSWAGRLAGRGEGGIVLGIRPEAIGPHAAPGASAALRGRVSVVERTGGQSCLYVEAGHQLGAGPPFAARVNTLGWTVGQAVELPLSLEKAVFFDPDSGLSLA